MAKICSSRAKPVIKGTASLLFFIVGISIANTCYGFITVFCPYRFLTLFRNKFLHAISVNGRKVTFVDNQPLFSLLLVSLARSWGSCGFSSSLGLSLGSSSARFDGGCLWIFLRGLSQVFSPARFACEILKFFPFGGGLKDSDSLNLNLFQRWLIKS